ncbi:MAG: bifunctional aspartate transaminase/aspartate 4-decarboxylase [Synergistaceae bacterium]|nr:bifunctional aspartate transaminase/aspartate 4-decarboxylase [Synergistaceae bacterium]
MTSDKTGDLSQLSPFELKNYLIDAAKDSKGSLMLNAGRGNPNFLSTLPREAFFEWGQFALQEAERSFSYLSAGLGGFPKRDGIEGRMYGFLQGRNSKGSGFIQNAVSYVRDQLGYDAGDFVYEMTEGILGIMYPVPDRMLSMSERIVEKYIRREMIGDEPFKDEIDLFAVEGGTAAMTYVFDTLEENFILRKGDTIAIGVPIFTPYLEIPRLREYNLVEVGIEAGYEDGWQFSNESLDRLLDPAIKAFFLVNPSNPPSVKMSDEKLAYLAKIIERRRDLIVLTDDVYGTFADGFKSIFAKCPRNTILVYSFSKYFGATGWRLGVIATAKDNVIDEIISKHPANTGKVLANRYASISVEPEKIKFIDRLVAESRAVGLNHTAGLATPAQVQMVLFSLFALMDDADNYKSAVKRLVRHRQAALYNELGAKAAQDANSVGYYTVIEVSDISEKIYGKAFKEWLEGRLRPNEMLFRLAKEAGTVLLPASGFGTADPGVRASLANLNEYDYVKIGRAVRTVLEEYYREYAARK